MDAPSLPVVTRVPVTRQYLLTAVRTKFICWRKGCNCSKALHLFPQICAERGLLTVERSPVFVRVPVSQEYLARAVATKFKCDRPHCGCKRANGAIFEDSFHESIRLLIYKLAQRFNPTCQDGLHDLVQECALRVYRKLHLFDSSRAQFSTWVWHVCNAALANRYRQNTRHARRYLTSDSLVQAAAVNPPSSMREDMIESLQELFGTYPEQKVLLRRVFGDPFEQDYSFPVKVSVRQAVKGTGLGYAWACSFFSTVVRPFFEERFGGMPT